MGEIISTDAVREQERLSYWNDLVCKTFVPLEVNPLSASPYFGAMIADQLAFIQFVEVSSHPSLIIRSKQSVAQTSTAYVQVIYQLAGQSVLDQAGRTAYLGPGDWVFVDCTQPSKLRHTSDHYIHLVLQIPKSIFCARLPNPEILTGYRLNSETGLGRVTYKLIQSIRQEIIQIEPETELQLAETLVNLLATNLSKTLSPTKTVRNRAVNLLEAKSFIHQHLADPELSVCMIAKALNISKSYLHLLFREENTTVNRYIWDLRLENCRADLASPFHTHRTITEIAFAWGFNHNSHFCRLFKERYGLSARGYRYSNCNRAKNVLKSKQ